LEVVLGDAAKRGYPFAELVEKLFPLHEANAALERAAASPAPRVALVP
jgi:hypothetical protein